MNEKTQKTETILCVRAKLLLISIWMYAAAFVIVTGYSAWNGEMKLTQKLIVFAMTAVIILPLLVEAVRQYQSKKVEVCGDKIRICKYSGKLRGKGRLDGKTSFHKDTFAAAEIYRIGYATELYGHNLEYHRRKSMSDTHDSEVVFELKNGQKITMDLGGFQRKDLQEFFHEISEKSGWIPAGELKRELSL